MVYSSYLTFTWYYVPQNYSALTIVFQFSNINIMRSGFEVKISKERNFPVLKRTKPKYIVKLITCIKSAD